MIRVVGIVVVASCGVAWLVVEVARAAVGAGVVVVGGLNCVCAGVCRGLDDITTGSVTAGSIADVRLYVRVIVGTGFCKESMGGNGKPGFAEEGNKSFPIFVGDLGGFESTEKIAIFLGVVITLTGGLLCHDGGNEDIELGDMLVDAVGSRLFEVEELAFESEFIFARFGSVALL